jgi:hypothetical protein
MLYFVAFIGYCGCGCDDEIIGIFTTKKLAEAGIASYCNSFTEEYQKPSHSVIETISGLDTVGTSINITHREHP